MIIPRPGQPPRTDGQITPIPLLPLRLPPEPLRYPALPSPLRDHRFSATYNVTTHIIPAAFPRSTPFIAPPPAFPSHEIDDEREARIQRYTRELISLQAQYVPDSSGTQPTVLWNVLNRYVRHGKGGGLTLLMLHANGMHKETFEPTIRHLLQAADEDTRYRIDEVWTLDAVQHGDAGLINADNLGALFTWSDHARDILNFILHFLPDTVTPSELPTHLPRVPLEVSSAREKRGFTNRELVVVGHSFSGCAATLAAHTAPAPFSGLVHVDPIIVPSTFNRDETIRNFIVRVLARRSGWSSREEAYSLMRKSPYFGAWDPDVFRSYVDYALVEDSSGKVTLKCNTIQEAVVFADKIRSIEAWSVLPEIDKRIAMKWIIPSLKKTIYQSYELVQEAVWRRAENVTNVVVAKAAHVVRLIWHKSFMHTQLTSQSGHPR
ncbi:Alpha/beta hydrolase family-domain-containing protein [Russula ochroleuca]|uniref:Alpha/beta hydrolase family-domain-containing protein n=1 Tax=Russula ochroleuca TaxID=152965 RepID=A0A9P5T8Q7_9AGAM|nr:Alpha/beta hydrolase family-domain-containing protein [Russula ochroleuca]